MYTHHEHTTYNHKLKFTCPICAKWKIRSESYPYKNVRICEECHNIIIQREKDAQP